MSDTCFFCSRKFTEHSTNEAWSCIEQISKGVKKT